MEDSRYPPDGIAPVPPASTELAARKRAKRQAPEAQPLPKYVTVFSDRYGRLRYRFRRIGGNSCYLPSPEDPEFKAAYLRALGDAPVPRRTVANKRPAPARPLDGLNYVYFLSQPNGPIQIGVSRCLRDRLYRLASASAPLKLLAFMPGDAALAADLHRRFADARLTGDWFRRTPELLAMIREIHKRPRQTMETAGLSGDALLRSGTEPTPRVSNPAVS